MRVIDTWKTRRASAVGWGRHARRWRRESLQQRISRSTAGMGTAADSESWRRRNGGSGEGEEDEKAAAARMSTLLRNMVVYSSSGACARSEVRFRSSFSAEALLKTF